jgi:hypothetical protein
MFDIDVGSSLSGSTASTHVQYNIWWYGSNQEVGLTYKIPAKTMWQMSGDGVCLPLSIAYEACQSPCICLTLMWDQV